MSGTTPVLFIGQMNRLWSGQVTITKTRLFKYIDNFTSKIENFQIKASDIFHISAQNIDCGYSTEPPRRGGSDEYPQSTCTTIYVLGRNKKINVYPCKPHFYCIKVGFKGDQNYIGMFSSWCFMVIDHEIIFTVIPPSPTRHPHSLIQEGHLSVAGKSMCTKVLVN